MPRIDLKVPYAEKDEAKKLGARWDPEKKLWFVSEGIEPLQFHRWLPDHLRVTARAPRYFIVQAPELCWKCKEVTTVFAFALPRGHEFLNDDCLVDEADGSASMFYEWVTSDSTAVTKHLEYMPPSIAEHVQVLTDAFRVDFSKTLGRSYWMNHCEDCGAKLGDQFLCQGPGDPFLCQGPGDPFWPISETLIEGTEFDPGDCPFEARCEVAWSEALENLTPFSIREEGALR